MQASFVYGVLATYAALACTSGLGRLVVAYRSMTAVRRLSFIFRPCKSLSEVNRFANYLA
jgi:hypothetical protein